MSSTTAQATRRHFGRYRIVKELGRGAMGVVHLAEDPALGRMVAIKTITLPSDASEQAEYEARFLQEAKAAGGLNHPNIITVHDIGREGDVAYMAMEVLDGVELKTLMAQRRLPLPMVLDIAAQIADGLAFAHQAGVIHRDIKPANIMIVRGNQVKIMDFGIARMRLSEVKTQTGLMLGSPKYMSPEQVTGLSMDHRSDIFTLGVLLYEMVSGVAPFSGSDFTQLIYHVVHTPIKPLSRVLPGLPEMLDEIVDRALAKEPIARYQNASKLAADLRACKAQLADSESSRSSFGSTSRMDHRTTTQSNRIVRQAYETATTIRTGRGIESQSTTRRQIELPHERELRLAQEEEARVALEKRINEGWTWLARYALGMVVVTVLGAVIGDLSLFKRTTLSSYDITASEFVRFLTYGSVLALLWHMALRATRQLRDRGENAARLGSVILPFATLVVVSMGYRVSLLVFAGVLSKHARGMYDWLAIFGIIGAALWLGLEVFRQSDRITDLLRFVAGRRSATLTCAKCGELIPGNAKFCGSCGAARAD